jgi:hypothetical protein
LSGSPNFQLSSYEICHSSLIVLQKQKTQKLTKTLENNKAKGLTSANQGVQIHDIWHSSECADVYSFGVFNGSAQVKKMDGCDFGWEKNRLDEVKFGSITRIDDMA